MTEKFPSDLLRGSLDLVVLGVLSGGAKYGYLILKEVRDASRGRVELQAGTLYPLLHRLEDERLIRSSWEDDSGRKRKWYALTAAGQKRLREQKREWANYVGCMEQLLGARSPGSPATT